MGLFRRRIGYFLKYERVLPSSNELFQITTNLPVGATKDDFDRAFDKMIYSPDNRREFLNRIIMEENAKEQAETPLNREQRRPLKNIAKKT